MTCSPRLREGERLPWLGVTALLGCREAGGVTYGPVMSVVRALQPPLGVHLGGGLLLGSRRRVVRVRWRGSLAAGLDPCRAGLRMWLV